MESKHIIVKEEVNNLSGEEEEEFSDYTTDKKQYCSTQDVSMKPVRKNKRKKKDQNVCFLYHINYECINFLYFIKFF